MFSGLVGVLGVVGADARGEPVEELRRDQHRGVGQGGAFDGDGHVVLPQGFGMRPGPGRLRQHTLSAVRTLCGCGLWLFLLFSEVCTTYFIDLDRDMVNEYVVHTSAKVRW